MIYIGDRCLIDDRWIDDRLYIDWWLIDIVDRY